MDDSELGALFVVALDDLVVQEPAHDSHGDVAELVIFDEGGGVVREQTWRAAREEGLHADAKKLHTLRERRAPDVVPEDAAEVDDVAALGDVAVEDASGPPTQAGESGLGVGVDVAELRHPRGS